MLEMKLQYLTVDQNVIIFSRRKHNSYSTQSKATILWLNLFLPRFEDFLKEAFWTRYQPFTVKIFSSCEWRNS